MFWGRKRHVVEKCVQSCLGESRPGRTKFLWCGFCGEETACCRKEASMVVQVKAALERKNGSGVGEEKTALGRQIVGEFLWRKRHVVEKCVQ
ncbi:hypothetical protein T11_11270, partial [Trichinella zimbabwensis]